MCSQAIAGPSASPRGSIGGGLKSRHFSSLRGKKPDPWCHIASQLKTDLIDSKSDKGQRKEARPEGKRGEQNSDWNPSSKVFAKFRHYFQ